MLMDSQRRIFPAVPDGFPRISEGCESRDELPRSGVIHQVESGIDELCFGHYKLLCFHGLFTSVKSPNDSASKISEFKSCPLVAAHPS